VTQLQSPAGSAGVPPASAMRARGSRVLAAIADSGGGRAPGPRFQERTPPGHSARVTNALTIDFEDWYQGLEIPHTEWAAYEDRIVPAGRRLLDLLDEAGVRATFFILGYVAEKHPRLVREIAAAGHEIGTHGYCHTLIYRLTHQTFRAGVCRSIGILEDLAGKPILGHRAPFFSITRESLWALEVLGELGLRYDSSIFPIRNYRYGIEDAPRWPHQLMARGRKMWEFPITTWRVRGKNLPVAGGAYFRLYPYAVTRHAFRAINRQGYPGVFYLHPWEIDPAHPRIRLPQRIALPHYMNLKSTEGRLRQLLRDFDFAPMGEVLHVC
jgi:polysaccharide deacetylase family protein (PEP-CTERM system associated)